MNKYSNLSKEDLLKLVEKQEAELSSKKYGLVWDSEREPEQVVLDCENNLPVLKHVKGKEIKTCDETDNILIEGDNYHALTVLNYTHKEKIDVIYIDPPYNTGAKDWKYNNRFVGEDDGYRHSKWLNMMEKRLNIAKNILKEDGIICITIDDYELRTLWMLLDKIFGENNHLGTVVIRNNPGGRKSKKKVALQHEYAIFFAKSIETKVSPFFVHPKDKNHKYYQDDSGNWFEERNLRKEGQDSLAIKKDGSFYDRYYSIYFNPKTGEISALKKLEIEILPIDTKNQKRIWRRGKDDIEKLYKNGDLSVKQTKHGYQVYFRFKGGLEGETPKSFWDDVRYSASEHGTSILDEIIGNSGSFSFPKSLYAVVDCIRVCSKNDNAIILDFFAGSGTTGQAVLKLNEDDGGNRKFILCTNNENGICEEVTYPRLQKVINGYNKNGNGEKVEGLGGNLQYFRTDLVKKTKSKDQVRVDLTQKCTQMLCVKENIFNLESKQEDYKIFSSHKKDKFLCVYYNFLDDSFEDFLKEIKKLKGKKIIYMFSMDGTVDVSLFNDVDDFDIEEIPQKILEIYKQLVKMNVSVKADTIFSDLDKAKVKIFEEKEKDEGARILRIVLEKTIQKIAQRSGMNILKENAKEEKAAILNDKLKNENIFSKVQWEENKTYLAIGNHASHGEYSEYELKHAENFYKHVQALIESFNI
ncbi:MAG: site-specific DNA-methyltransferase [Candidatus Moranbacteria bacterium]|nr:site-specific DNA-methyltransferase [Candidatus Moranbacteria bacterium]